MFPIRDDNPSRSFPAVTLLLIVLNVVMFLAQATLGPGFTNVLSMYPKLVTHVPLATLPIGLPVWATVFTSMFMHGSFMHILGNMWFLWIFGNNVEDTLGHVRFLLFYLFCGLCAAALQILMSWNSPIPTLGASGAIAGVLGAYSFLFPEARVTTLLGWILLELPARAVLGFWFILQFINLVMNTTSTLRGAPEQGGVAFGAHVGGFVAGMLVIRWLAPRRPPRYRSIERPRFIDDDWRE